MKKDIFISHSSLDNEPKEYCRRLEAAGLKCWIAPRDIKPGQTYQQGILDGIEQCSTMLVFISSNALDRSNEIGKEVTLAEYDGKRIIPVFIENVRLRGQLKYDLINKQWIEAWQGIDLGISGLEKVFGKITSGTPATATTQQAPPKEEPVIADNDLFDVMLYKIGPNKLAFVKLIKEILGCSLDMAKYTVDSAPSVIKTSVSENERNIIMQQIADAGGMAVYSCRKKNEGKAKYAVRLIAAGANKLMMVKRVKELLNINLAKAKNFVDSAPCIIIIGLTEVESARLVQEIKFAGGDARSERM